MVCMQRCAKHVSSRYVQIPGHISHSYTFLQAPNLYRQQRFGTPWRRFCGSSFQRPRPTNPQLTLSWFILLQDLEGRMYDALLTEDMGETEARTDVICKVMQDWCVFDWQESGQSYASMSAEIFFSRRKGWWKIVGGWAWKGGQVMFFWRCCSSLQLPVGEQRETWRNMAKAWRLPASGLTPCLTGNLYIYIYMNAASLVRMGMVAPGGEAVPTINPEGRWKRITIHGDPDMTCYVIAGDLHQTADRGVPWGGLHGRGGGGAHGEEAQGGSL